eukprot:TRINITY_DN21863_c0_g1_i1.p1 TRINITY_DN21863_c0_g1~~TRINITY_DN21863_c0_g1_i1.p1  ORF type:complete len:3659 (-),score=474.78 TRINITY_DN21863_c0_g1_i1:339-10115(-)
MHFGTEVRGNQSLQIKCTAGSPAGGIWMSPDGREVEGNVKCLPMDDFCPPIVGYTIFRGNYIQLDENMWTLNYVGSGRRAFRSIATMACRNDRQMWHSYGDMKVSCGYDANGTGPAWRGEQGHLAITVHCFYTGSPIIDTAYIENGCFFGNFRPAANFSLPVYFTRVGAILFWYKPTSWQVGSAILQSSLSNGKWELTVIGDGLWRAKVADGVGDVTIDVSQNGTKGLDEWYHVAFTWQLGVGLAGMGNMYLYVDGILAPPTTPSSGDTRASDHLNHFIWVDPEDNLFIGGTHSLTSPGDYSNVRVFVRYSPFDEVEIIRAAEDPTCGMTDDICPPAWMHQAYVRKVDNPADFRFSLFPRRPAGELTLSCYPGHSPYDGDLKIVCTVDGTWMRYGTNEPAVPLRCCRNTLDYCPPIDLAGITGAVVERTGSDALTFCAEVPRGTNGGVSDKLILQFDPCPEIEALDAARLELTNGFNLSSQGTLTCLPGYEPKELNMDEHLMCSRGTYDPSFKGYLVVQGRWLTLDGLEPRWLQCQAIQNLCPDPRQPGMIIVDITGERRIGSTATLQCLPAYQSTIGTNIIATCQSEPANGENTTALRGQWVIDTLGNLEEVMPCRRRADFCGGPQFEELVTDDNGPNESKSIRRIQVGYGLPASLLAKTAFRDELQLLPERSYMVSERGRRLDDIVELECKEPYSYSYGDDKLRCSGSAVEDQGSLRSLQGARAVALLCRDPTLAVEGETWFSNKCREGSQSFVFAPPNLSVGGGTVSLWWQLPNETSARAVLWAAVKDSCLQQADLEVAEAHASMSNASGDLQTLQLSSNESSNDSNLSNDTSDENVSNDTNTSYDIADDPNMSYNYSDAFNVSNETEGVPGARMLTGAQHTSDTSDGTYPRSLTAASDSASGNTSFVDSDSNDSNDSSEDTGNASNDTLVGDEINISNESNVTGVENASHVSNESNASNESNGSAENNGSVENYTSIGIQTLRTAVLPIDPCSLAQSMSYNAGWLSVQLGPSTGVFEVNLPELGFDAGDWVHLAYSWSDAGLATDLWINGVSLRSPTAYYMTPDEKAAQAGRQAQMAALAAGLSAIEAGMRAAEAAGRQAATHAQTSGRSSEESAASAGRAAQRAGIAAGLDESQAAAVAASAAGQAASASAAEQGLSTEEVAAEAGRAAHVAAEAVGMNAVHAARAAAAAAGEAAAVYAHDLPIDQVAAMSGQAAQPAGEAAGLTDAQAASSAAAAAYDAAAARLRASGISESNATSVAVQSAQKASSNAGQVQHVAALDAIMAAFNAATEHAEIAGATEANAFMTGVRAAEEAGKTILMLAPCWPPHGPETSSRSSIHLLAPCWYPPDEEARSAAVAVAYASSLERTSVFGESEGGEVVASISAQRAFEALGVSSQEASKATIALVYRFTAERAAYAPSTLLQPDWYFDTHGITPPSKVARLAAEAAFRSAEAISHEIANSTFLEIAYNYTYLSVLTYNNYKSQDSPSDDPIIYATLAALQAGEMTGLSPAEVGKINVVIRFNAAAQSATNSDKSNYEAAAEASSEAQRAANMSAQYTPVALTSRVVQHTIVAAAFEFFAERALVAGKLRSEAEAEAKMLAQWAGEVAGLSSMEAAEVAAAAALGFDPFPPLQDINDSSEATADNGSSDFADAKLPSVSDTHEGDANVTNQSSKAGTAAETEMNDTTWTLDVSDEVNQTNSSDTNLTHGLSADYDEDSNSLGTSSKASSMQTFVSNITLRERIVLAFENGWIRAPLDSIALDPDDTFQLHMGWPVDSTELTKATANDGWRTLHRLFNRPLSLADVHWSVVYEKPYCPVLHCPPLLENRFGDEDGILLHHSHQYLLTNLDDPSIPPLPRIPTSRVHLECDPGYLQSGGRSMVACGWNGEWSGKPLECCAFDETFCGDVPLEFTYAAVPEANTTLTFKQIAAPEIRCGGDVNDTIFGKTRSIGSRLRMICPPGYIQIAGSYEILCQLDDGLNGTRRGHWIDGATRGELEIPMCAVDEHWCPPLKAGLNSYLVNATRGRMIGSTGFFRCIDDAVYMPDAGNITVRCLTRSDDAGGYWADAFGKIAQSLSCQAKAGMLTTTTTTTSEEAASSLTAGVLSGLPGDQGLYADRRFRANATLGCGYPFINIHGDTHIYCVVGPSNETEDGTTGRWVDHQGSNLELPLCILKIDWCPSINLNGLNSEVLSMTGGYEFDSVATLRCHWGYQRSHGNITLKCVNHESLTYGEWDASPLVCELQPFFCPPPDPTNAYVVEKDLSFVLGTEVNMKCQRGFVYLEGESQMFCNTSDLNNGGQWKMRDGAVAKAMVCVSTDTYCSIPNVSNGYVTSLTSSGQLGSVAQLHCHDGFLDPQSKMKQRTALCSPQTMTAGHFRVGLSHTSRDMLRALALTRDILEQLEAHDTAESRMEDYSWETRVEFEERWRTELGDGLRELEHNEYVNDALHGLPHFDGLSSKFLAHFTTDHVRLLLRLLASYSEEKHDISTERAWADFAAFDKLKISFQGGTLAAPPGWLEDVGEPFGDRSNGFKYGWKCDVSDLQINAGAANRQRELASTLENTLVATDPLSRCMDQEWRIQLPMGEYSVEVTIQDTQHYSDSYGCVLQGKNMHFPRKVGPPGTAETRTVLVNVTTYLSLFADEDTGCSTINRITIQALKKSTALSPPMLSCEPIPGWCVVPEPPPNAHLVAPSAAAVVPLGNEVQFACDDHYVYDLGLERLMCGSAADGRSGQWRSLVGAQAKTLMSCTLNRTWCPPPPTLINAVIESIQPGHYSVGSKVKLVCQRGFRRSAGDSSVRCTDAGVWCSHSGQSACTVPARWLECEPIPDYCPARLASKEGGPYISSMEANVTAGEEGADEKASHEYIRLTSIIPLPAGRLGQAVSVACPANHQRVSGDLDVVCGHGPGERGDWQRARPANVILDTNVDDSVIRLIDEATAEPVVCELEEKFGLRRLYYTRLSGLFNDHNVSGSDIVPNVDHNTSNFDAIHYSSNLKPSEDEYYTLSVEVIGSFLLSFEGSVLLSGRSKGLLSEVFVAEPLYLRSTQFYAVSLQYWSDPVLPTQGPGSETLDRHLRLLWTEGNSTPTPVPPTNFYHTFEPLHGYPILTNSVNDPSPCPNFVPVLINVDEGDRGFIADGTKGLRYNENSYCSWEFRADKKVRWEIAVNEYFALPLSPGCVGDNVQIALGTGNVLEVAGSFCGTYAPGDVLLSEVAVKMVISFASDDSTEMEGFNISYRIKNDRTGPVPTVPRRDGQS